MIALAVFVAALAAMILIGGVLLVAAIYFDELFDKVFNTPWTD